MHYKVLNSCFSNPLKIGKNYKLYSIGFIITLKTCRARR